MHASWTHRDPPSMSLLDVCMADVRDTVVIEMELEGIKKGTCKVGTRGPSYAELQRRRHDREVQKAKRAGKEMFKNTDGHLIDPKSSYQPKNRKTSSSKKKASQIQSQPGSHQSAPSHNPCPSDPATLQGCFTFGSSLSVPCPPASQNSYPNVIHPTVSRYPYPTISQSSVPQNPSPTVSKSADPQNPYPQMQPSQLAFGPQPSPVPCSAQNRPQHPPPSSSSIHPFSSPTFVSPHTAVPMASQWPAASTQWQPWMSPYEYEVVLLPRIVQKCYGCGSNFVDKYRSSPYNLVIKHMDRRIAGKDSFGQLRYSVDFNNTYYHPSMAHIQKKNPIFDGNVCISRSLYDSLDHDQHQVLDALQLTVSIT